ncbi:MAG: hypothetical protein WAM58_08105 [Candidatus Acidiferrum sp.]
MSSVTRRRIRSVFVKAISIAPWCNPDLLALALFKLKVDFFHAGVTRRAMMAIPADGQAVLFRWPDRGNVAFRESLNFGMRNKDTSTLAPNAQHAASDQDVDR